MQKTSFAAIVTFLAVLLAVIPPELGQANGSASKGGKLQVTEIDRPIVRSSFTSSFERASERMYPTPKLASDPNPTIPAAANYGTAALQQSGGVTLTREEYEQFKRLTKISRAAPYEVALVNIAVKGTSLLMYFCVWLLGLVIFRYVFNRWFDEDVYRETWPSVAVIVAMIVCTAWVLVSTVQ